MSEEITEPEVVESPVSEAPVEESREERFATAISGQERDEEGRFTTTEQPPADEPSPQEEVAAVEEETPVSEGPTQQVLAAATAVLPPDVVEKATSDSELLLLMQMAKRFQDAQPEPEPAAQEPELTLEWPDDDVPEDDPYRKQIERILSHFQEKDKKREENLQAIAQWALSREERETAAREEAMQKQFDELLDKAEIAAFGKSDKIVAGKSPEWQKRNAAYAEYATLTNQLGYPPELAIQAIAMKNGKAPSPQPPSPPPSILKQAKSRLGGAPSRPAPAPTLSREERFAQEVAALQ